VAKKHSRRNCFGGVLAPCSSENLPVPGAGPAAQLPSVDALLHRKADKLAPLIHLSPWHGKPPEKGIPANLDVSAMSPNTCR
jgi:hypothetical protein